MFLDADTLGDDLDLSELLTYSCQLWPMSNETNVIERCQNADFIITNKVVINAETMSKLPKLKLICVAATGMNNVDLVAAKKRNIQVKNVTNYAGSSIAQLTFSLISELLCHTNYYVNLVQQGKWSQSPHFCVLDRPIVELSGKKIALVGYGALAQSVEKIAQAYDMQVLICERKNATTIRHGRVSFEEALSSADIFSVHCPLSAETQDLIGVNEFKAMKNTAVIINTARGGIVNEEQLLTALSQQEIAGAATDVLTQEPPHPDHIMLAAKANNLIITPHIAWATKEARQRLLNKVLVNVQQTFATN